MTLKDKTVTGITWSFIDNYTDYFIQFVIGIILARLLTPKDFGLIGMITVFLAISQSFVVSGFSQALIRKQDATQDDYSTVFFFNFGASAICYLILFLTADFISNFYNEPQLSLIIRILGLTIIINAISQIQRTIIIKNINFKQQAKISVLSSLSSGIIGVSFAFFGFGVWSLIIKAISMALISSFFYWIWNKWKPVFVFSMKSFKELFSFGSKLLISSLIETVFSNSYYIIIGKYFSAVELGFYSRANMFQSLPSQNLAGAIERVTYPVLSSIRNDKEKIKKTFGLILTSTMLITFTLMLGLAAVAKPLVITLIGDKWEPCIIYLQLLCFSGMFYPLHLLNLNILNVYGRSDLFLRLELIKKVLFVPTIIIGVIYGIKIMIVSFIATNIISYFLNGFWTGELIDYSVFKQIKDIFVPFVIALLMSVVVFTEGIFLDFLPVQVILAFQLLTGSIIIIIVYELLKFESYTYLKSTIKEKLLSIKLLR